jgi:hypothetical protein
MGWHVGLRRDGQVCREPHHLSPRGPFPAACRFQIFFSPMDVGLIAVSGFLVGPSNVPKTKPSSMAGKNILVSECRQSLSPDGSTEFGGVYVPAETTAPAPAPTLTSTPTSPASGLAPPPPRTDSLGRCRHPGLREYRKHSWHADSFRCTPSPRAKRRWSTRHRHTGFTRPPA